MALIWLLCLLAIGSSRSTGIHQTMGIGRVSLKGLSAWQMKIHAFGVFRTRKEKCFVLLEKTAPFSACSSSVFALAYRTHARSLRGWLSRLEHTLICAT